MLAIALGHAAVDARLRASYCTAPTSWRLTQSRRRRPLTTTMRFVNGPGVLIVDELGYLSMPAEDANALFQVISQRSLRASIILTTNRGVASWGDIFDNTTPGAATLNRLLHRSVVVVSIAGDSCRMGAPSSRPQAHRRR